MTRMNTYQQIEFMVENGFTLTIDASYENAKFIVSISATSNGSWSFEDKSIPVAIQQAFDTVTANIPKP